MSEDRGLNEFVQKSLEGDVGVDIPHFDDIMRAASEHSASVAAKRRIRTRLWGGSLLAASLAGFCAIAVVNLQAPAPSTEATVATAIDLMRMADGAEPADGEASVAEMLLALQDAPYESAVSDLLASSGSTADGP